MIRGAIALVATVAFLDERAARRRREDQQAADAARARWEFNTQIWAMTRPDRDWTPPPPCPTPRRRRWWQP